MKFSESLWNYHRDEIEDASGNASEGNHLSIRQKQQKKRIRLLIPPQNYYKLSLASIYQDKRMQAFFNKLISKQK